MNLLLTGATGFVGQNFIRYLSHSPFDIHVFAPTRKIPDNSLPNVTWLPYTEDWSSCFEEHAIDAIIHLLGKAHDTKNTTEGSEYYRINFEITKQLFQAFSSSNAKKFIFLSTIKTVGDDQTYVKNSEDLREPQTPYAKSKKQAEDYIRSFPLSEGKNYYILRPTLIYGPKIKGNLATLVKFVQKGLPYPFSAFENKRSYLSVNNLSFIFITLLTTNYPNFTLNIANADPVGTKEIMDILSSALDKKSSSLMLPESSIRLVARIGDLFPFFPLNTEKLEKITSSFVVDTQEMETKLGLTLPELTRNTISSILKD